MPYLFTQKVNPCVSLVLPGLRRTCEKVYSTNSDVHHQWRLKYCMARSCFSAAGLDLKVPRFRRFPVFGFFFFE